MTAPIRPPAGLDALPLNRDDGNAHLAAVVASSTDGIVSSTLDGGVRLWNPAMTRLFGYTADEMIGQSAAILTPESRRDERTAIMTRVRAGETVTLETERLHRDGTCIAVELTVFPVRDASGTLTATGAIVKDIRGRVRAEAALRESARLLRDAQQVARLGSWRWEVATNTITWSEMLCELYGIAPSDAPSDFAGYLALVHPDDRAEAAMHAERALRERTPFAFIHRVIHANGRVRYLHGRGDAIADATGQLVALVGSSQDVTERVLMEQALRESETRYRALADATPALLWQDDAEGNRAFVNRAWLELTGRSIEQELGLGWLEGVHPEDRERVQAIVSSPDRAGTRTEVEYRLRAADGTWRWLLSVGAPRRAEDGTLTGYVGSCVDLTERKAAEVERERLLAEAEAASRAKGEFLAVMSHELRTPLNAIGGYVELLEMGIRGPVTEAQAEDLRRVRRNQQHLLTMISEILEYTRVEAGRAELRITEVPVREVLERSDALVAPQLRARRLVVPPVQCDGALAVRADPEKLVQVLVNLLGNAAKFTGEGGTVAISCEAAGDVVHLRVRDTGPGIAAHQLDRIFEPFYQVDRSLTRTAEGVGLGLAISRDLARAMGGDVTAESRLGEGSTFTVTLPRAG